MPIPKFTFRFSLDVFASLLFTFSFLLLLFFAGAAVAQNETKSFVKDPMNKPDIWNKLKHSPNNQFLWENYLGKKIQNFTKDDNDKIAIWQEKLMILQADNADVVVTSKSNTNATDEAILRDMQVGDWNNLEEVVMSTGSEIKEMRENIEENFALLEDLYSESFEDQGLKYVSYKEVYPDGKYSKTTWIELQEEKLRQAKLKELQALRNQIKKN